MEQRPGLISVRTDVAKEVLVRSMFEAAAEREAAGLPHEAEELIAGALEELGAKGATAERLARLGYASRVVECERFAPARAPIDWLTGELADAEAATVAARRAGGEPAGRPRPDDEQARTWRVPGPGGHVRHYLALRAMEEAAAPGHGSADELKRYWLCGFFARCCEEALADAGDPPGTR